MSVWFSNFPKIFLSYRNIRWPVIDQLEESPVSDDRPATKQESVFTSS